MNWHFLFFFIDIVGWIGIAMFSSYFSVVLTTKTTIRSALKPDVIGIAICAGILSIFANGLPDAGFSANSFTYAFLFSFSYALYQQIPKKKIRIKKIAF